MAKIPQAEHPATDSTAPQPHDPWLRALEAARKARVATEAALAQSVECERAAFSARAGLAEDPQSQKWAAMERPERWVVPEWLVVLASALVGGMTAWMLAYRLWG